MEQNMQYLYEYRNGKRTRNIGFMKIEESMDKSVIQIYAKAIDSVVGIIFQKENGEKYTAGWEEELVAIEEPPVQEPPKQEAPIQEPLKQEVPIEEPPVQIMSTQEQSAKVSPIEEQEMEIEEYITPSNVIYEKIQRQELSRLPRREWRIANNSFLLHGCYNYHHLLYIEEDGQIWIGVPGIFHEREQAAARAFGFTEFRRLTDGQIELEENEKNIYEDFGYWCRQIPRT